jgi:hypothetical protein
MHTNDKAYPEVWHVKHCIPSARKWTNLSRQTVHFILYLKTLILIVLCRRPKIVNYPSHDPKSTSAYSEPYLSNDVCFIILAAHSPREGLGRDPWLENLSSNIRFHTDNEIENKPHAEKCIFRLICKGKSWAPCTINLGANGSQWSAFRRGYITPEERAPGAPWRAAWVPTAVSDALPVQKIKPQQLARPAQLTELSRLRYAVNVKTCLTN